MDIVAIARRQAMSVAKKLNLDEHVALARDQRRPDRAIVERNARDERHLAAVLAAVLREDSAAVDVGANVGTVLSTIVRLAPRGHHVAFEPIPSLALRLAQRFPTVDVHSAAASSARGTDTFLCIDEHPALSGFRLRAGAEHDYTPIQVRLERIDDVVAEPIAVLKIDVEGSEEGVLLGAQETLARYRPLVAFEHGTPAAEVFGTSAEKVFDLLAAPGLRIFDMDGSGPFSRDEFCQVVGVGDHFNFIAC
jgi:FkbM family methyltransferase